MSTGMKAQDILVIRGRMNELNLGMIVGSEQYGPLFAGARTVLFVEEGTSDVKLLKSNLAAKLVELDLR